MAEKHAVATLLRSSWGDAIVLLATLLLTIFRDLTEGILVGFALGTVLFMHRMSEAIRVEGGAPLVREDQADDANGQRAPYDAAFATNPDVVVYRISGAFFFGAAATVGAVLERIADRPKTLVLDFSDVPFLDSTAAHAIEAAVAKASRAGVRVLLTGTTHTLRQVLWANGVHPPKVRFKNSVDDALAAAGRLKRALPRPWRRQWCIRSSPAEQDRNPRKREADRGHQEAHWQRRATGAVPECIAAQEQHDDGDRI